MLPRPRTSLAFWLGLLLLFAVIARARAADVDATVPGHPELSRFGLAKLLVTDLGPAENGVAEGHETVPFKHIEGADVTGEPAATITLHYYDIETAALPGDPSQLLLLVDLGPQDGFVANANLLALVALTPTPHVLDVVEVGDDRWTEFPKNATQILLAPRTPLILIISGHDNSDQTYTATEMLFVRDDRFRFIDTYWTLDEQSCSYKLTETPSIKSIRDSGPYAGIGLSIVVRISSTGEEGCSEKPPRPRVIIYRANYRWGAQLQRFRTNSTDLKRLAAENRM